MSAEFDQEPVESDPHSFNPFDPDVVEANILLTNRNNFLMKKRLIRWRGVLPLTPHQWVLAFAQDRAFALLHSDSAPEHTTRFFKDQNIEFALSKLGLEEPEGPHVAFHTQFFGEITPLQKLLPSTYSAAFDYTAMHRTPVF